VGAVYLKGYCLTYSLAHLEILDRFNGSRDNRKNTVLLFLLGVFAPIIAFLVTGNSMKKIFKKK